MSNFYSDSAQKRLAMIEAERAAMEMMTVRTTLTPRDAKNCGLIEDIVEAAIPADARWWQAWFRSLIALPTSDGDSIAPAAWRYSPQGVTLATDVRKSLFARAWSNQQSAKPE